MTDSTYFTPPVIMVVDDSRVIRAMVLAQLQSHGHETMDADNGADAIERCRHSPPDVILLDVEMPVLDGYGTLSQLKADPLLKDIPVVFLTARDRTADVITGLELGAHDYLRKPFDPGELIARVSAALRVKRLQDALRRSNEELAFTSRVDYLTGVYNRRQLDWETERMAATLQRSRESVAALMIDIDHFKTINDRHGHVHGDHVLSDLVTVMRGCLRVEEVIGRWGGEEFLVLLSPGDEASAKAVAERLRVAVEQHVHVSPGGPPTRVTVSIGWAVARWGETETLIPRADEALYAAKAAGRNTVVGETASGSAVSP